MIPKYIAVDALALAQVGVIGGQVKVATTTALPANTYNNTLGTITANSPGTFGPIDGVSSFAPNDRILVKNEPGGIPNGYYQITSLGAVSSHWILTRTSDGVGTVLQGGRVTSVQLGTQRGQWALTTTGTITLGTTSLDFVRVEQVMNVKLFGAKGDGVTDDQPAFAAAIAALSAIGGGTLYCPATPGSAYLIKSKLTIPDEVLILGDGIGATTIRATAGVAAPWSNTPGEGMLEMRGAKNAGLHDPTVDGNSALRTFTGGDPLSDSIDHLLNMAAAQNCTIERVRFTAAGYAASTGDTPSGPVVLLVAKDTPADIGGQFGTVAAQDCSGNVIRKCKFDDAGGTTRCEKGIGIITDFGSRTAGGSPHNYAFNPSRRQTTINGSVTLGATNIVVVDSHGFAIGDSIRIERASNSSLFDHGNVTAIPDATHVTIDTATTRTYSASDKFGTSYDALSPLGTGGAPSSALRGRAVDPAGSGRNGVATTVSGSMSSSATSVLVTSSEDIALGDTIQITRSADHTLFDLGVVTAIPDGTHVTIGTPTTRTYSASDLVTVPTGGFSPASGFNGGDYFLYHAQDNVIEDNEFTGVSPLYAIGLQGGATRKNTVQRNRFNSVRSLGLVLEDKGAYANDILNNVGYDHQRDSIFLTSSPMASFVGRSVPSYYDTDNRFEGNKIYSFIGTLEYDAPFAVGEGAVRQLWIKNTVDGAFVSGNLGMAFMIGQGNIDCEVDGNAVRETDYGIFSNLGGAPTIAGSGCKFVDNTIDVTHQAIQLTATASAVASWGGAVQIKRNRISGTSDVAGQIAVDATLAVALVHDNYVERKGAPGAGHIGLSIGAQSGVVGHNIAKNHDTAYVFASTYHGLQHDNLAIGSATKDVDFQVTKTPLFTRLQSALPQAQTRIVEVVSITNIASLSGAPVTIDGISIPAGLDVLLTGQSTGSQNIIWTVQGGAWTPSYDLQDGASAGGMVVAVKEGTANHDSVWLCTNDTGADIVGTNNLTWSLLASTAVYAEAVAAYAAAVTNATPNDAALAIVQRDGSGNFAAGVITATDIDNAAATLVRIGFNTLSTKVGTPGGNLALFGGTLRTQPTRAGQITDSTTGTPGTTLAAAGGSVYATDFPTIINWIASLAAKYNSLEGKISAAGTGIGATQ